MAVYSHDGKMTGDVRCYCPKCGVNVRLASYMEAYCPVCGSALLPLPAPTIPRWRSLLIALTAFTLAALMFGLLIYVNG